MTSFWHPFADMARRRDAGGELVLVRGEGAHVWDDARTALPRCDRRRSGTATSATAATEIADAAAAQMRELAAYSTFGDLTNRPAAALAERVAALAPVAGSKVFLTSGGSDSIDTADQDGPPLLAAASGEPERTHPDPPRAGLPRHAHGGHVARRHPRRTRRATAR